MWRSRRQPAASHRASRRRWTRQVVQHRRDIEPAPADHLGGGEVGSRTPSFRGHRQRPPPRPPDDRPLVRQPGTVTFHTDVTIDTALAITFSSTVATVLPNTFKVGDEVSISGATAAPTETSTTQTLHGRHRDCPPERLHHHPVPADHSGRHRVEGGDHHRTSSRSAPPDRLRRATRQSPWSCGLPSMMRSRSLGSITWRHRHARRTGRYSRRRCHPNGD